MKLHGRTSALKSLIHSCNNFLPCPVDVYILCIFIFCCYRIESATIDGADRKVIIQNVPHVFGVTLYGDYLYWTDWVTRSVMRAEKHSGGNRIALKEKLDAQPMDIKVFSQGRQNCKTLILFLHMMSCEV